MRGAWRSLIRRATYGCVFLVLVTLDIDRVVRSYLASRFSTSQEQPHLEKAVRLEPMNADHHHRLGLHFMFVEQDPASAIENYRAAVALNPYVARYWLDLAGAYQLTAQAEEQSRALENALRVDPTTPSVVWEVANMHLLSGASTRALREFRIVVENDPEDLKPALELCWRGTRDVEKILDEALPPKVSAHFGLLELLIEKGETLAARKVWSRLLTLREPFAARQAFPYLQYLIETGEIETAQRTWQQLAGVNPSLLPYSSSDNLVLNGGFEQDILNGGFDWRYEPKPQVRVSVDTTESHDGGRSLLLTFAGEPVEDIGVWQFVPVQPGAQYEFTGHMKAENIESGSGPRFAISDASGHAQFAVTEDSIGSSAWQQRRAVFHANKDTRLVVVKIIRSPGQTRIRGKAWIDDLRLVRK